MESVDAARLVKLPGSRSIAIRPITGADVDLLGLHVAELATWACDGHDGRSSRPYPLMEGRARSLAAEADAIVVLVVDDERREQLIRGHQQLRPSVPVFVAPRSGRTTPSGCVELPTSGAANVIERLLSVIGEDAALKPVWEGRLGTLAARPGTLERGRIRGRGPALGDRGR